MTEIKDEKTDSEIKAALGKLEAEIAVAEGWIKLHTAWLLGFVCMVVGALIGHFMTRH